MNFIMHSRDSTELCACKRCVSNDWLAPPTRALTTLKEPNPSAFYQTGMSLDLSINLILRFFGWSRWRVVSKLNCVRLLIVRFTFTIVRIRSQGQNLETGFSNVDVQIFLHREWRKSFLTGRTGARRCIITTANQSKLLNVRRCEDFCSVCAFCKHLDMCHKVLILRLGCKGGEILTIKLIFHTVEKPKTSVDLLRYWKSYSNLQKVSLILNIYFLVLWMCIYRSCLYKNIRM